MRLPLDIRRDGALYGCADGAGWEAGATAPPAALSILAHRTARCIAQVGRLCTSGANKKQEWCTVFKYNYERRALMRASMSAAVVYEDMETRIELRA